MSTNQQGFSLIELLLVIAIFGLLAGIILLSIGTVQERARLANLYAFSGSVFRALGAECAGQWELDDNTGTSLADRCQANTATIESGTTWVEGINNTPGLEFDGVDDYARITNMPDYDPQVGFTIEAFIYPHTTQGHEIFVSANRPLLSRNGSRFRFAWNTPGGGSNFTQQESDYIVPNRWYHVLGTHDGVTAKLYVDGELVKQKNTALGTSTNSTYDIGRHLQNNNFAFDGVIDSVRMYLEPLPE